MKLLPHISSNSTNWMPHSKCWQNIGLLEDHSSIKDNEIQLLKVAAPILSFFTLQACTSAQQHIRYTYRCRLTSKDQPHEINFKDIQMYTRVILYPPENKHPFFSVVDVADGTYVRICAMHLKSLWPPSLAIYWVYFCIEPPTLKSGDNQHHPHHFFILISLLWQWYLERDAYQKV